MNDRKRDFINSQIFDTTTIISLEIEQNILVIRPVFSYLFERNFFQALERPSHLALLLPVALLDFDRRRICRVASIDVLCLKFGHFSE